MLEAKDVSISYGSRRAISSASLELRKGEILAIVGANGAGKSTLLRALNGAIKPTSGEVFLNDVPLTSYSRRAISKKIAAVSQEADLRFPVTVMEFVLGGRYAWASTSAWGWETAEDLRIVETVLRDTELEDFSVRLMNELSGGERQRAVLARALATEAPILLLDEPTANLDLGHQASLLSLVRKRCDEIGTSAVVVTHDVNLAAEFADRVLLLKHGKTIATGTPVEVLTETSIYEVFEVRTLVDAHPISGVPRITPVHETHRHE